MEKIKFNGCMHLDFSDNYAAVKNKINANGQIKVCWNRPVISRDQPSLVQFCKMRGRLNSPESCLCKKNRQCNDYEEFEHVVKNIED